MEINTSEQVIQLINQTHQNIFLTGKAGTGKTTLLKHIVATTYKKFIIVAPTGVAAINAGGVTIHSMFQLPFVPLLPTDDYNAYYGQPRFETKKSILRHFKVRADKRSLLNSLELLVIDEVSMLRPDTLDAIDIMLRHLRNISKPFGGVQVLFIGDLMQLPPIIKNDEWEVMSQYYDGKFFFHAHVLRSEQPIYVELTKIWRQEDDYFIQLLQKLRQNRIDNEVIEALTPYVDTEFDIKDNPGYIVLTTHNRQADLINTEALAAIQEREISFDAEIIDEFPENLYPIDKELKLKLGAQVMFIKNDMAPEKRYYNGKIGYVKIINRDELVVRFPDENKELEVDKFTWENIRYTINPVNQEIQEEILGTFTHYPLRLAWAITVHKSQGLTFEKAAIDISKLFAPGQAYVALSRLVSLQGLKLLQPLTVRNIHTEEDILNYEKYKSSSEEIERNLGVYTQDFLYEICMRTFNYNNLKHGLQRIIEEARAAGAQSIVAKDKKWLEELQYKTNEILEVAVKFQASLFRIVNKADIKLFRERIEKSYDYFFPRWVEVEKLVLTKMYELSYVSRVKEYENDIREIEAHVFSILKQLERLKKMVICIDKGSSLDKQSLSSSEIELLKQKLVREIGDIPTTHLASLAKSSGTKSKSKEPKKSTYEISFELWQKSKSIEQVALTRKLTSQTISGHLLKYVEKGEIDIEELIDIDRLKLIYKKLQGKQDFESITHMRSFLNDEFEFTELRLYKVWVSMQHF